MATRLTHWLLVTLIISLGFGQLLRLELFGLPIFLHDILTAILTPLLFTYRVRKFSPPLWFRLILLGLVIGTIRALTLFPLQDLLIPILYSARLITYLALYLCLRYKPLVISRKPFILAGAISLTIGLTQYFLMPDMRVFQHLGWDDHLSRLTLPHFDPTFSAAMLVMYLLFFSQRLICPGRTSRPISYLLLVISYSAGILLTYSRSIWLSLALTGLFFIKKKTVLLLAISCMLLAIFLLPKRFGEGTNLLRTYSISSRLQHDFTLAKRVGWNFVIGTGYNTLPFLTDSPELDAPNHATGFNNSFLTILATSGIIGLIGWVIFLHSLYQNHPRIRPILIFLVIGSMFNNLLLYPFTLLFLLLASLYRPSEN